MKLVILLYAFLFSFNAITQGERRVLDEDNSWIEAQFPGGSSALVDFISESIDYENIEIKRNEQGRVYVTFIVEINGTISNIEIKRGLTPQLDSEAIRIISSMPRWEPSTENGQRIRTRCSLPINFTLEAKRKAIRKN